MSVIVEGILHTSSYGPVLRQLMADHPGPSHVFYLDVGFAETVRRHHSRAEPIPVTADDMQGWFTPHDVLGVVGEHVIPECSRWSRPSPQSWTAAAWPGWPRDAVPGPVPALRGETGQR